MYPREIQQALNEVAKKYAPLFQRSIMNQFNQEKLKASGYLASSVKVKWDAATATTAPQIIIEYEDYGNFIGSRRLIWTSQPPVDKIKEWIDSKGAKFKIKAVPGYFSGRSAPGISIDKQKLRIAFAISKKLKFRQKLGRTYKWKRAGLPDVLRSMNKDLIYAWTQETEQLIAKSISGKT